MYSIGAPVAQLDRATDYGSVGWGFKSLRARQGLCEALEVFLLLGFPGLPNSLSSLSRIGEPKLSDILLLPLTFLASSLLREAPSAHLSSSRCVSPCGKRLKPGREEKRTQREKKGPPVLGKLCRFTPKISLRKASPSSPKAVQSLGITLRSYGYSLLLGRTMKFEASVSSLG